MLKILLVDDDEDFVFLLKPQFETAGYEVLTAHSGAQALKILADTRPDVAIVDLMMKETDEGFRLCYWIKKKDSSIPVIMTTSVTRDTGLEFDAATEEERSWIKADVLLRKPVRIEQLEREIERLLKKG